MATLYNSQRGELLSELEKKQAPDCRRILGQEHPQTWPSSAAPRAMCSRHEFHLYCHPLFAVFFHHGVQLYLAGAVSFERIKYLIRQLTRQIIYESDGEELEGLDGLPYIKAEDFVPW